jgi:hypothetical protein
MEEHFSEEESRFWNEWFDVSSLPDDLRKKLSIYDLKRLAQRAIAVLSNMANDRETRS